MYMAYCNSVIGKIFLKIADKSMAKDINFYYPGVIDVIELIPYNKYKLKNREKNKEFYNIYN